jgi:hypothetical protein
MTDNLKPCPFCNSDPKLEGDDHWWYAVCRCGADGGADQTAKKAIEIWNTRPIEDALRAQLAEAQAEVDRLTVQLEEAGKALSGLGYTPSADDSGSYDSLIPDKYL